MIKTVGDLKKELDKYDNTTLIFRKDILPVRITETKIEEVKSFVCKKKHKAVVIN